MSRNNLAVYIFDVNEWLKKNLKTDLPVVGGAAIDAATAIKLVKEFGFNGKARSVKYQGRHFVVLSGRPGLRPNVKGTRYLAANPKMITYAVGKVGRAVNAAGVFRFVVVAYAALHLVEAIIKKQEFHSAVVSLGSSVVKAVVAVSAGHIAAATLGIVFGGVAVGFIVAAVVTVGAAMALESVDQRYKLTQRVVTAIEDAFAEAARLNNRMEQRIIKRALDRALGSM